MADRIRDILEAMAAENPLTRDRYLEWCAERDRFEAWKREQDAGRAAKKAPARSEVLPVKRKRAAWRGSI